MNKPLWTIKEISEAVGAVIKKDGNVTGVSFNSNDVLPGHLFVALEGEVTDGHKFVNEAFVKGAIAALVKSDFEGNDPRLLKVENTLNALWDLARAARQRMTGQVVAITGSAGKTSTKAALKLALTRTTKTHANKKSFNNHVGVPLSLARMPRDTEVGIFELGMNGPDEIGPLSELVKPNIAIITSIGRAHRAGFKQDEEIALAKAEIFTGLAKEGVAIWPENITHKYILNIAAENAKISTIIEVPSEVGGVGEVYLNKKYIHSNSTCVSANILGDDFTFKVGIPGEHAFQNGLLLLTAVKLLEGDLALAGITLGEMKPLKGRGRQYEVSNADMRFTVIDDSYNANALSMTASLKSLALNREIKNGGRAIAVLGEMNELGEVSYEEHLALGPLLEEAGVGLLIGIGRGMKDLVKDYSGQYQKEWYPNKMGVLESLKQQVRSGDVIILKGATHLGLEKIVNGLLDLDESETHWEGKELSQAAE